MKLLFVIAGLIVSSQTMAETPRQLIDGYAVEASQQQPEFRPSAQRGAQFFARDFRVSEKMPACVACHTDNPAQPGRHAVTGKSIKPLAPVANAERFTDPARVEKWFRRNCKEVVGRECSPAEKADVVQYLAEVR